MAVVNLLHPFDMLAFDQFRGSHWEFRHDVIYVAGGPTQAYFYGEFSYNSFGDVFGTVRAVDLYTNNTLVVTMDNLAANAYDVGYLIEVNRIQEAVDYMMAGPDTVYGSPGPDVIIGGAGNDDLFGGGGNDRFFPGSGTNLIDGGSGLDTVFYQHSSSAYSISRSGDAIFVQGGGAFDRLVNVERVDFSNATLALDVGFGQNAGMAYRIYQAAFDRTPDAGGLSFWINAIDSGWSILDVANGFVGSAEFRSVYGTNPTIQDYVARLYHNVLGRDGEAGGVAYWEGQLAAGASQAFVLANFSESAENIAGVAPEIGGGIWYV